MEHFLLTEWIHNNNLNVSPSIHAKLVRFANLIYENNKKFNLTGRNTVEDIINKLIIESIDPFCELNVPRGTSFCDIGTGAGIPGVPVALLFEEFSGTLIDSSLKKITFIKNTIKKLNIDNINAITSRAEEISRGDGFRSNFNIVISRAMGNIYLSAEICASLIKTNGILYLYSSIEPEKIQIEVLKHAERLGLELVQRKDFGNYGIKEKGILFKKIDCTADKYPRRYSVIKRESEKYK